MAVEMLLPHVAKVMKSQLGLHARYRCLLFQSSQLGVLSELNECVKQVAASAEEAVHEVDAMEMFDDDGAKSCNEVLTRILTDGKSRLVIVAGPLHFMDYWTSLTRALFWRELAAFSSGPGVVVLDVSRSEGVEGPFRVSGAIQGTDVRYLRSRLAAVEAGAKQ